MRPFSLLLSSLLITLGLAQGGPAPRLIDFQTVLELARTVSLLNEVDATGLPLDAVQAKAMLTIVHALDQSKAITPGEAAAIVKQLEGALRPAQLLSLKQKRQALETVARKRVAQSRMASSNALTVMSWTVPGGPLIVSIIEREWQVNPLRVKGTQEAYNKLLAMLEKRSQS
jgi:hypothetical protein